MTEPVVYKMLKPNVCELVLNRPVKANALNPEMIQCLTDYLDQLKQDADVRVLVISGKSKFFCAGADLAWLAESENNGGEQNYQQALQLAELLAKLNDMPLAVIGKVKGGAYGGGLGLLCCCDYVMATDDCDFAFSEVKLGLLPSTIMPYVLNAIGQRQARRFLLSAERFGSQLAKDIGLIHEIVKPYQLDKAVVKKVDVFLQTGPGALQRCKQLIHNRRTPSREDIEASARSLAEIRTSEEAVAGIKAFLEKNKPPWFDEMDDD